MQPSPRARPAPFTVTSTGNPTAALGESGTLPTGVTFADNGDGTAILAGTPGAGTAGTYPITFTATNGLGTPATQSFTLTIDASPAITSAASTTFTAGSAGSFTVTATGNPVPTIARTGTLPSGVTFSGGVLSGTPASGTAGTYPLTFTATNGVGSPATQSFTLTVDSAPAITSADHATFTAGSAGSFTVTATGTPAATLSETGALPSGVSFSGGVLSGTPAPGTGGSYPIAFTATNGVGTPATQSFTLTVDSAPAITSANHATFTEGSAGSFTVTASGPPAATVSETGTLPSGVGFGAGVLSGTPGEGTAGSYSITFTATNGVGTPATQSFTLTVDSAPAITSADHATFAEGSAGSFTVTSTGKPDRGVVRDGHAPFRGDAHRQR